MQSNLVEIRCPGCNALLARIQFGVVEVRCRKCSLTHTQRVDTNETVNVLRAPKRG